MANNLWERFKTQLISTFNWKKIVRFFIFNRTNCTPISDEQYYKRFKIEKHANIVYEANDKRMLKAAYEKAWENRNYEIDKFWSRALYFWGFIAATFVAYTAILTADDVKKNEIMDMHFDIYVLALGVIFSLAWLLVIKGSKRWQENWEKHIDKLENLVSGPLYKTIFYERKRYYSVSKLNGMMAFTVLLVWIGLFAQTLYTRYSPSFTNIDLITTLIVGFTCIIMFAMLFGYGVTDIYHAGEKGFIDRTERDKIKEEKRKKKNPISSGDTSE